MVRSFGVSDSGAVRRTNEDCFLADEELSLFVVADGMGGHAAGEVASRLAVESIEAFIRRSHESEDITWPCGLDAELTAAGNRVRTAIHLANRRVFTMAEADDGYSGMGTTVVCALISGRRLAFGHVGDSRLYVWSNGVLTPQTRDDTWAATLAAAGTHDQAAIDTHPMRHVLTNVLGTREQVEIHVAERDLVAGELLLLCSDGVHGVLDVAAMTTILAERSDLKTRVDAIVAAAIARGSRDNVTALLVQYEDERTADA